MIYSENRSPKQIKGLHIGVRVCNEQQFLKKIQILTVQNHKTLYN